MKLKYVFHLYKIVTPVKSGKDCINDSFTGPKKTIQYSTCNRLKWMTRLNFSISCKEYIIKQYMELPERIQIYFPRI